MRAGWERTRLVVVDGRRLWQTRIVLGWRVYDRDGTLLGTHDREPFPDLRQLCRRWGWRITVVVGPVTREEPA